MKANVKLSFQVVRPGTFFPPSFNFCFKSEDFWELERRKIARLL